MTLPEAVIAYAECPGCGDGRRNVGLVRRGLHLAWRDHRQPGQPTTCPSSGHWLCEAPPLRLPTARCTSRCDTPLWVPIDPHATPRKTFEVTYD